MSDQRRKVPSGMRQALDRLNYDRVMEDLEELRCSNCLESLGEAESIYELRVASPAPDEEAEVVDHYCSKCVMIDRARRKKEVPPSEGS